METILRRGESHISQEEGVWFISLNTYLKKKTKASFRNLEA
jgi:hypothetical protein